MKVCIVGISNLKHMTLISLYTDYFETYGIPYDLIYIDKYGIDEKNKAEKAYKLQETSTGIMGKIIKIIRFIIFSTDILKRNKYDFVVIWREQTAVMLAPFLAKYYRGKYSVNIRDLFRSNNPILEYLLTYAIKYSAFNTISSEGFRNYLPGNCEYIMVHSVNANVVNNILPSKRKMIDEPICILYLGTVRFYDYCKQIIDCFGNDKRFIVKFIGQGSVELEEYASEKKYDNVVCLGAFDSSETVRLLKGADIMNCAFGADSNQEKYLTPIRFYYSLYMRIPSLTTEGTWINQQCKELSMSLTLPPVITDNKRTADDIFEKYQSINREYMSNCIDTYINEIEKNNSKFLNELKRIVK